MLWAPLGQHGLCMNDHALRLALLAGPLAPEALGPEVRVVQEVVLAEGRVVDLLVLRPGSLQAWEIKGEGDRLGRLAGQAEAYQACCHQLNLLCHPKHLAKAQAQVPSWWGLWVGDEAGVRSHRAAGANPMLDPWALVGLLGVPELRSAMRLVAPVKGLAQLKRQPLLRLWRQSLGEQEAQALAIAQLRAREPWGRQGDKLGRGRQGGPLQAVLWRGPTHLAPHPHHGKPERRRTERLACGHEVLVALAPFAKRAERRRCPQCRDAPAP